MTTQSEQAVSPVIAVILMVAVTVILSAAVGAFVFNLGSSVDDSSNSQKLGVQLEETSHGVSVTVVTGQADELQVLVEGEPAGTLQNPSSGETIQVPASEGQTVSVVTTNSESKNVITSTDVSAAQPVVNGLVARYRFESGGGETAFDVAGPHEGTVNGSEFTWTPRGYVMSFPGDSGRVSQPHINISESYTIAGWIYRDTNGTWDTVTTQGYYSNQTRTWWFGGDNNCDCASIQSFNSTGTQFSRYSSDGSVPRDTWVFITGTFTGSKLNIYVNGTLDNARTNVNGEWQGTLETNNLAGNIGSTDGSVDDVMIFNRSLSEQEIQELYNATK